MVRILVGTLKVYEVFDKRRQGFPDHSLGLFSTIQKAKEFKDTFNEGERKFITIFEREVR